MPIRTTLLAEIQASLGAAVIPSLTGADAANDIFEGYVFSLILEAGRTEGATISFRDAQGNVPSTFVFRTSPGHIFSAIQPYCYAVIEFPGKPSLEAHLGIYVGGKSKILHECDVAVLFEDEAQLCRINLVPPRYSEVILSVECKFYSSGLKLDLARSFMGLSSDLTSRNSYFVVNTNSESIEKLLTHHGKNWEHEIVPASPIAVARLRGAFQREYRNFKARY